jgi:hypothetical protein
MELQKELKGFSLPLHKYLNSLLNVLAKVVIPVTGLGGL